MRRLNWLVTPAAVMAMAAFASAGTVQGQSDPLEMNQEVTGPAVITSEAGDTIKLREGAIVQFLGTETDENGASAELYFLKEGAVDASTGYYTRLSTPAFWAFPSQEGGKANYYAETFSGTTGYARAARGSNMVRLLVDKDLMMEVDLLADQGVALERRDGGLSFTTDPNNEFKNGRVRVIYPLPTGLMVDLAVPKATSGFIRPHPTADGKTEVANLVTSWKSGKIRIVTILNGSQTGSGEIGPGVVAVIDNATGRIEIGFVQIDFATLKAAVSLTSEFESLATSPISKP